MSEIGQIENTTKQITQELSLKQISKIFIQNWPLFILLFVLLTAISSAFYAFKVPFVSTASLIVNDGQNSSLQSFVQQAMTGSSIKLNEAKKSNSAIQKYLEYLKTTEFYQILVQKSIDPTNNSALTLSEKEGQKLFIKNILNIKNASELKQIDEVAVYRRIESMLTFKVTSDYELEISTSSDSKELSLFMTNLVLKLTQETLKNKETEELNKIQSFLNQQKVIINSELEGLNKKLAEFQNKPENLISLSSKDKVGEYISELMVRKNEYQMKISENNKMINVLSGGSQKRESQLYGNGGRIQALKIENDMLLAKIGQTQAAIDRVTQQAKSIPMAAQTFEELKKKTEIEFTKYKEVSENLTKAEAYQLSLANKFEILEKARFEKVKPLVSLTTLILVSLVLSQIIGSLVIYISTIWDSNLVTAESTRNVVVIDSHSLDPRVIIENSKIKFRLRNAEFDRQNDPENGVTKKLGFNFMPKAEGDDQTPKT